MHTPGPWQVAPHYPDDVLAAGDDVATTYTPGGTGLKTSSERAANARLIAAAPDLLAALEDAIVVVSEYEALHGGNVTPRLRAAIAKAKGERK